MIRPTHASAAPQSTTPMFHVEHFPSGLSMSAADIVD
jgi:hypothetical protein